MVKPVAKGRRYSVFLWRARSEKGREEEGGGGRRTTADRNMVRGRNAGVVGEGRKTGRRGIVAMSKTFVESRGSCFWCCFGNYGMR